MVADSVAFLRAHDMRVFLDAEHFFDGYRHNRDFASPVLAAAEEAGAEALVLCDTNGGSLPDDIGRAVADVRGAHRRPAGHPLPQRHGCAVANSLVAVQAGVTQVQGCINGYGERAGNTDLSAAIPNLSLKLHIRTIPADRLERLTPVSHHIAELVNIAPEPPAALRGRLGLRPQGRPARQRRGPPARSLRARRARARWATAPGWWSRRWPAARRWP